MNGYQARMLLWTVLLSLLFAHGQGVEQHEEMQAVSMVRLIGQGDAEALFALMEESFLPDVWKKRPSEAWRQFAGQLTSRHRGLEIVGVQISEAHRITIESKESGGMVLRFGFEFEPEAPHRIVGLAVEAGPPDQSPGMELPPLDLAGNPSEKEIRERLAAYFRDLAERDLFSGAALLAVRGKAIFTTAQGLASKRWNVPNSVQTRFDLGSVNKTFTRVAVARLLAEDSLKLDDRILDHLSDYPNREVGSKITIRHLLEHSSGLGDIFNEKFFRSSRALYRDPRDFFPVFVDEPLLFEPGSSSRYSNAGYMVLGAIIAAVSGEPYDLYVGRHIFEVAGMYSTGFFAKDEPVPQVAEGYTSRGGVPGRKHYLSNVFMLPVRGNSAGSAYSTVEDLLRFDTALREHRLLPPAYTQWVYGGPEPGPNSPADSERVAVGIGWAGGAPGVSAVLESDGNMALVILSNYDEPIAEAVARTIYLPLQRVLMLESGEK